MPLNSNVLISTENYAEGGVLAAQVEALPGHEFEKMLRQNTYESARISQPSSENTIYFQVNLGKMCPVGVVALLKTNFTQFSTWCVKLYDRQNGSLLYNSGTVNVFRGEGTYGSDNWGQFPWGSLVSEENFSNFSINAINPTDEVYSCSYIEIEVTLNDRSKAFFECFLLWIGGAFQPEINADYGAEIVAIDDTDSKSSKSGNRSYGSPIRRRAITLEFNGIHRLEFWRKFFGPILQKTGKARLVLVCMTPTEYETLMYQTVCGNLKNETKASHAFWNRLNTVLEIEESP